MTYNFDPDRWYETERARLEMRRRAGELTAAQFEEALDRLDRRYDAMLNRLDGTFPVAGRTGPK
jgi:hypothetical protein